MRINEKLSLLNRVTNNGKIIIEREPNSNYVFVTNYEDLIQALDYLASEEWNNLDDARIQDIIKKYGFQGSEKKLNTNEYNWLSSYVDDLNQKYPFYYSIITTQVLEEDEKALNILIPSSINSFQELINFNKNLSRFFNDLKVIEEIKFISFDKGTDWIVLAVNSITAYYLVMTCLEIAQKIVNLKKTYHEGEIAKLQHQALLKKVPNFDLTEDDFKKITIDSFTEENINKLFTPEALKQLSRYGTNEELLAGIRMGIPELIQILEKGSQIVPANNHPKFLTTESGNINIDVKTYITYKDDKNDEGEQPLLNSGKDAKEDEEGEEDGDVK